MSTSILEGQSRSTAFPSSVPEDINRSVSLHMHFYIWGPTYHNLHFHHRRPISLHLKKAQDLCIYLQLVSLYLHHQFYSLILGSVYLHFKGASFSPPLF